MSSHIKMSDRSLLSTHWGSVIPFASIICTILSLSTFEHDDCAFKHLPVFWPVGDANPVALNGVCGLQYFEIIFSALNFIFVIVDLYGYRDFRKNPGTQRIYIAILFTFIGVACLGTPMKSRLDRAGVIDRGIAISALSFITIYIGIGDLLALMIFRAKSWFN